LNIKVLYRFAKRFRPDCDRPSR